MKRHPSQEDQKATPPKAQDHRNNCRHHEDPPSQPIITTKEPAAQTQINPVENVHDVHTSSQMSEKDAHGSTRSPIFHDTFPTFLNSIKEYVTEKDGNTYIPLHATIVLKNRRRMLYLPLEFGELTMDGPVDSGAFINAMSWSEYNAIKMNSDNCVIKEYPQPPCKIECANAQLEQPIATADIQFNIGTYTFTDTFVKLSKTSFPINGLNLMRNHQAVIDTANGTITFPHVEMTLAMTDKKKNCNPKPLQIMAEGHQTLPPQQTTTVNAIVITTNAIDITEAIQSTRKFGRRCLLCQDQFHKKINKFATTILKFKTFTPFKFTQQSTEIIILEEFGCWYLVILGQLGHVHILFPCIDIRQRRNTTTP